MNSGFFSFFQKGLFFTVSVLYGNGAVLLLKVNRQNRNYGGTPPGSFSKYTVEQMYFRFLLEHIVPVTITSSIKVIIL